MDVPEYFTDPDDEKIEEIQEMAKKVCKKHTAITDEASAYQFAIMSEWAMHNSHEENDPVSVEEMMLGQMMQQFYVSLEILNELRSKNKGG